jgi:hypothetical protein
MKEDLELFIELSDLVRDVYFCLVVQGGTGFSSMLMGEGVFEAGGVGHCFCFRELFRSLFNHYFSLLYITICYVALAA